MTFPDPLPAEVTSPHRVPVAVISPLPISPAAVSQSPRVAHDPVAAVFHRAGRVPPPAHVLRAAERSCLPVIVRVAAKACALRRNLLAGPSLRPARSHRVAPVLTAREGNLRSFRPKARGTFWVPPPASALEPPSEAPLRNAEVVTWLKGGRARANESGPNSGLTGISVHKTATAIGRTG